MIFFIAWKALYLSLLLPHRTLDRPLTYSVGIGTSKTLDFISHSKDYSAVSGVNRSYPEPGAKAVLENAMVVYFHDERVLSIADVCNGLELMVLYAGFIICLPSGASRKTAFIAAGILLIFFVNILRCMALVLVYLHYREYVEFFHHYVFTFLVYGFIFWLWSLFSRGSGFVKKLRLNAVPPSYMLPPGSSGGRQL